MLAGIWAYVRHHHLALLALFIALGGTAWALEANSVGSRELQNQAVKTKEIANRAVKTKKIGKGAVTRAKLAGSEPYHHVGSTIFQPAFKDGWDNVGTPYSTAGFYKDPLGVVHLKGTIHGPSGSGEVAFTLPEAYRPSQRLLLPMAVSGSDDGQLSIAANGDVIPECGSTLSCIAGIDGLTFRVP